MRIGKSKIKEMLWRERRKYRIQNKNEGSDMQGREERKLPYQG
jgi:hypothetical protein